MLFKSDMPGTCFASGRRYAVNLAGLFDSFTQILGEFPSKQDWMSHLHGVAQIVHLNGPTQYRSGLAQRLFLASRSNLVRAMILSCSFT